MKISNICGLCGHQLQKGTFVIDPYQKKICLDCCTKLDREMLHKEDTVLMYYDVKHHEVTNEPGTLRYPIIKESLGNHNSGRQRLTIWFNADEEKWWGIVYGSNTNLVHCRKIKSSAASAS